MALRKVLAMSRRQHSTAVLPALASTRSFAHKTAFDDKEEALEQQFMYKHNKKQMEDLAHKVHMAEVNQDEAKAELCAILNSNAIPEDVMQKLFAWKDKYNRTRLGTTGLER